MSSYPQLGCKPPRRRRITGVRTQFVLPFIAVSALLASGPSCIDHLCIRIGCTDGLIVEVTGTVPAEAMIVATSADGRERTAPCPAGDGCWAGFDGFHPEEVTVRVTWPGDSVVVTARPQYTVSQPNGPDCPPTCRSDLVKIRI